MNTNIESLAYDRGNTLRFVAVDSEAEAGQWIETDTWSELQQ